MTRDKKDLRIVFFGTPEFAVESLDRLVKGGYNVVGVVTMPDKVGGRGNKVVQSAVKLYAVEHGLNLMQPEKLKDPGFIEQLRSLKADLQIVIAFRMMPEWTRCAKGWTRYRRCRRRCSSRCAVGTRKRGWRGCNKRCNGETLRIGRRWIGRTRSG